MLPGNECFTLATCAAPRHALRARKVEVPVFPFEGALHVRISAQVYNSMTDYERLADLMLELQGASG